jgi:pimeloyl-ACP methyl ester carboxylesterase
MRVPDVRFADASGVSVAWTQFGSGPDVLAIPPLVSNIELAWENEVFRRFLEFQGEHVRITAFDKRGIGLSDKIREPPTLQQRTDDITAVMDAAGLDRAVVLGHSEGGLMAQLFAVHHPERVEKLVLVNSNPGLAGFLATHQDADGGYGPLERKLERFEGLTSSWGRDPQFFVDWFAPSRSDDPAFVRWMGRYQRQSATVADLESQMRSFASLDAADELGRISAPTLVIHATDDAVVPVAAGRYLADRIPGARFVEVPGGDHMAEVGSSWAEISELKIEFATGTPARRRPERSLATVVFTDIVGSTAQAIQVGDRRWRDVLDRHDVVAWELAERHGGGVITSTGDGVLVRFDVPSSAVAFARQFRDAAGEIGVAVRCGVHSGEIEVRDDGDISGVAVHLASRVTDAAGGFDGAWRLFQLVT